MKYLKSYKIFENYNRFGTKTLSEKEFDQIRKENCKNWTKAETELYRGMPDLGDYLLVDPLKGDFRSSIEDTNIHLDLLSNLPSWKDYPKYERCVIGGSPGAAEESQKRDAILTLYKNKLVELKQRLKVLKKLLKI